MQSDKTAVCCYYQSLTPMSNEPAFVDERRDILRRNVADKADRSIKIKSKQTKKHTERDATILHVV